MDTLTSNDVLNQVEEVCIIDLLEPTMGLSEKLLNALLPDPLGIYIKGQIDPLFYDGRTYILVDKNNTKLFNCTTEHILQYITETSSVPEFKHCNAIVDSSGKTVIKIPQLNAYRKFVVTTPTYPVIAANMVEAVLLHYLYTVCRYNRHTINLYKFIKDNEEYTELVDKEEFQIELDAYIDRIMKFIGNDYSYLYFHKRQGCSLILEKAVDYRIYMYYKMLEEKNSKDDDF